MCVFVTNLLNFIFRNKMFMRIEKLSQRRGWEQSYRVDVNKFMFNYLLTFLLLRFSKILLY